MALALATEEPRSAAKRASPILRVSVWVPKPLLINSGSHLPIHCTMAVSRLIFAIWSWEV